MAKPFPQHYRRFCFAYIGGLILLIVSIMFAVIFRLYFHPMISIDDSPMIISVEKAMPAARFVHLLEAKKLIQNTHVLLFFLRLSGKAHALKAGIYEVRPGQTVFDFLTRVLNNDVLKQTFRIIEGTTQNDVSAALAKAPYLIYSTTDWETLTSSFSKAEGLLLADTYHYDAGTSARSLLQQAHNQLEKYLQEAWENRSEHLPYQSSYEMLVVASILQKEAAVIEEQRLISGIIVNRLDKHMRLQMDPTVMYGLCGDVRKAPLQHKDLLIDTPYNTYAHRGLPPTPIAFVSKAAIDAAAHPTKTQYLYFVAKGNGTHHFSETYEEQKQAIALYLRKNK